MSEEYKHRNLTENIIKAAYSVHNSLGFGFSEKVYENALVIELEEMGLAVKQQEPVTVFYRDQVVGNFAPDIIVDGKIIVELKAVSVLDKIHEVQLVNYLKATKVELGLLINFGNKVEVKRRIFDQ